MRNPGGQETHRYDLLVTWAPPSGPRRRWAEVVAAILAYVAAMYFSYVDTFIYFLDSPFRPNGPYGSIPNDPLGAGLSANTCLAPHLIFGQICRDWSETATSTSSRVGFGAVFLIGFLLLGLLARRFAWIFLVVPLATIPYAHTERKVWAVSALVAFLSTGALIGLQRLARGSPATRVRWLPVGVLTTGVACAVVLSVILGPPVPPLHVVPGLMTWSSSSVDGIACPSPSACLAVGEHDATNSSIAITLSLRGDEWSRPTRLGRTFGLSGIDALTDVSCAGVGDCIGLDSQTSQLLADHDGRWTKDDGGDLSQLSNVFFAPTTACSPGGTCWAAYHEYAPGASDFQESYAVGVRKGRWLPAHLIGPRLSAHAKAHHGAVFVSGLSCWSASSCTFTGAVDGGGTWSVFVQTESDGVWGAPQLVPTDLGANRNEVFTSFPLWSSIACTARGTCLLGGWVVRGDTTIGLATEQEVNGRWLPPSVGDGITSGGNGANVLEVACHGPALCIASGDGQTRGGGWIDFRAEVAGHWQRALQVSTGEPYDGFGGFARASAAVCPTASTCEVVGWTYLSERGLQGFVASYEHGQWTYWTYGLGLGYRWTRLTGVACDRAACWAVGTANDDQAEIGFSFPLNPR